MEKELSIKIMNELFTKLNLNSNKLANALGMSRAQGIYDVMNPDKTNVGISKNLAEKICTTFPTVNKSYLLTGEGEMLKTDSAFSSNAKPVSDMHYMHIPFVPIYAQGGYGRGFGDIGYIESLPTMPVIVDKQYRGKYRVFEVAGDSMDDGSRRAIYDGDKILCREIKRELWQSKLHFKDWFFVIVMLNDGITVKQITAHEVEGGKIHCHPLNPEFDDFIVSLDEVAELFNVIKIVDRNTRI